MASDIESAEEFARNWQIMAAPIRARDAQIRAAAIEECLRACAVPASGSNPRPQRQAMNARLTELSLLKDDWNSYGAHKPSAAALKAADVLATFLDQTFADGFRIYPTPDGGLLFEQDGYEDDSVDVKIEPDGKIAVEP